MTRCAVIGAGAWGTALAHHLATLGHDVAIWAHEEDVARSITTSHTNRFLPGAMLAPSLRASSRLQDVLHDAELVTVVTPSHVTRSVCERAAPLMPDAVVVLVASKGIEERTLSRMSVVVADATGRDGVVALSGPSFAAEVARAQPTAVVASSTNPEHAHFVQRVFHGGTMRVYTGHDTIGAELGGALKNVIAVATGVSDGLGLGLNAQAALITRGLAEITRLGLALGAHPATFAGLAGMGDLVLTCTGALSRNRALGIEIGGGATLDAALAGRESVAEGVVTTRSARALAERADVSMPIVEAVYGVLFGGISARSAIGALMNRDPRPERDA